MEEHRKYWFVNEPQNDHRHDKPDEEFNTKAHDEEVDDCKEYREGQGKRQKNSPDFGDYEARGGLKTRPKTLVSP